jgi:hypothetical protein
MTKETNALVSSFVESISTLPYQDVLEVVNQLSVRIFVCAPQASGLDALGECHKLQEDLLIKFFSEKENTKNVVDAGIEGFGGFARSAGGQN